MSYVIEEGIPLPVARRGKGGQNTGPRTDWLRLVDSLNPGQSVLTPDWSEFRAADQFANRNKARKRYAIRKVDGQGWRVWRIE